MSTKTYRVELVYTVYADVEVSPGFDPEENDGELYEKASNQGWDLLEAGEFEMDIMDIAEINVEESNKTLYALNNEGKL
jgi:hypothetical protein